MTLKSICISFFLFLFQEKETFVENLNPGDLACAFLHKLLENDLQLN